MTSLTTGIHDNIQSFDKTAPLDFGQRKVGNFRTIYGHYTGIDEPLIGTENKRATFLAYELNLVCTNLVVIDEKHHENHETVLEPGGVAALRSLRAVVDPIVIGLEMTENLTGDGGVMIEIENERLGRELLFVIPPDGLFRYFYATDEEGFRLAGVVDLDMGAKSLARWVAGECERPRTIGLVLPR